MSQTELTQTNEDECDPPIAVDPLTWVDEHGDVLFSYAYMRIRDRNIVEDLVQETLLSALAAVGKYHGSSNVRTWLIGILRHKIADHFRATSARRQIDLKEMDDSPYQCHGRLQAWQTNPSDIAEDKEFWGVFDDCTSKLPEKLADAFYLREIADLDMAEICNTLDISPSNLGVRVFRARAALRLCLDKNWFSKG